MGRKLLLLFAFTNYISLYLSYGHSKMDAKIIFKANSRYLLPNDFKDELVTSGLQQPTDLKFLPNGKALISQKDGKIFLCDPYASTPELSLFLTIPNLNTEFERGLLTMCLDPDFTSNNYFYVYHSTNDGRLRLSRFTASGNSSNISSEFIIWQTHANYINFGKNLYHLGGALAISKAGEIFLVIGDLQEIEKVQDLQKFHGKLLRLNKDGSIPNDNPFYNGGAASGPNGELSEIYAWGLRNPFKASYDEVSKKFIMGEVGGNNHEKSWENLRYGVKGANYGWPECGDENRDSDGNCNGPNFVDPIYAYKHKPNRGNSITGGFVYRGGNFPAEYQGAYFLADYAQSWIRYLKMDNNLNITSLGTGESRMEEFVSPSGTFGMVDIEQGPKGEIFYLMFNKGAQNTGQLRKIYYTNGNIAPPVITKALVDKTKGETPLTVNFNGEAQYLGSQTLTYNWDFGDGTKSGSPVIAHTYTKSGTYKARFSVIIPGITVQSEEITIQVGEPPVVTINSPINNSKFIASQKIILDGDATDDGLLSENDFVWYVDFLHDDHTHPFINGISGKKAEFTIPSSGHSFESETGFIVKLTVKDADNLSTVEADTIYPTKTILTFETQPSGLKIHLDGAPKQTPHVHDELVGFTSQIDVISPQTLNGKTYKFTGWSDGKSKNHMITNPAQDSNLIAYFEEVAPPPSTIYEAEDNYTIAAETGKYKINKIYGKILSQETGVSIFDKGDKINIKLNNVSGSKYQVKVRLRSGHNGNPIAYWPDGYEFTLDGEPLSMLGDNASLSAFSGELGGFYLGTMNSVPPVELASGDYILTITAKSNWQWIDYVELVNIGPVAKKDPTADAGPDLNISLPTDQVTITGKGLDPDGGTVKFAWSQISGPNNATLIGKNASLVVASNLYEGTYKFKLMVEDDEGTTAYDSMMVVVTPPMNIKPIVDAGLDRTIVLPKDSVMLSGSGSDPDGGDVAFLWKQVSGPSQLQLSGLELAKLNVKGLQEGIYTFSLTVTDDELSSEVDFVTIKVLPKPNTNKDPIVDAGIDRTIVAPKDTVVLLGAGSDPDGGSVTYSWKQVEGPSQAVLSETDKSFLRVSGLVEGVYKLSLKVTDDELSLAEDFVTITVLPKPNTNKNPIVDAGPDKEITLPNNYVALPGNGYDPDGGQVTFLWSQVSGPSSPVLQYKTTSELRINGLVEGLYKFKLKVTDDENVAVEDEVQIIVKPEIKGGDVIQGITLINASSNQSIGIYDPITNGGEINIAKLPHTNLNIKAQTTKKVGSISFILTAVSGGGKNHTQTESVEPYALFGDSGGNYNEWGSGSPKAGFHYSLLIKAFDQPGGKGNLLEELTINFSFIDESLPPVKKDPIANAGADQILTLPSNSISLFGDGNDPDGGSVTFKWTQISGPNNSTMEGENTKILKISNLVEGSYTYKLEVKDDEGMVKDDNVTVTVKPEPTSGGSGVIESISLINADLNIPITFYNPISKNGIIDLSKLSTQNLNIRTNTIGENIGSVKFELQGFGGAANHSKTEGMAPYALFGDNGGNYANWPPSTPKDGYSYNLTVKAYDKGGAQGNVIGEYNISFSFNNGSASARYSISDDMYLLEEGIDLYPNPTSGELNLKLEVLENDKVELLIFNALGQQVFKNSYFGSIQTKFNLKDFGAEKGIYITKVLKNGAFLRSLKIVLD
ncbi:PKD domain-containing protein [Flexithrix dorotheae]|uniref:PKD domain-containing protein n=1 Tax=Flexithrix dorotheae TaxID=70993 RepID=UPI00037EDA05|nr:PQQ-dependent sugar dehydrogenase [Flexithrix dorotheae]